VVVMRASAGRSAEAWGDSRLDTIVVVGQLPDGLSTDHDPRPSRKPDLRVPRLYVHVALNMRSQGRLARPAPWRALHDVESGRCIPHSESRLSKCSRMVEP
jgi:hypothetical protein